MFRYQVET